jgi:hypothetical protein
MNVKVPGSKKGNTFLINRVKQPTSQELPLLIEEGYFPEFCNVCITENPKASTIGKKGKDDKNINSPRAPLH